MAQFDDLNDDCLLEVLDLLPPEQMLKVRRVNRRMKLLANDKIRVKTKAISLKESDCSDCVHHLSKIGRHQVMVLKPLFDRFYPFPIDPTRIASFLDVLAICVRVKSIDLGYSDLPDGLLVEVVRRCPDLECVKFTTMVNKDVWDCAFDQIGHKIIHTVGVVRNWHGSSEAAQLLKVVAKKCPNMKQVDWVINEKSPTSDLLAAIKMLPKSCRVKLKCGIFTEGIFEDVVHLLDAHTFVWPALGHQVDRLSSLRARFKPSRGPVLGVDFAGLKTVSLSVEQMYIVKFVDCLAASRFPRLESFSLIPCAGIADADYEALFKQMPLLKRLRMHCGPANWYGQLPRSSIRQLKKLETFYLNVLRRFPEDFFQHLEQYVDGISSLKKLTVEVDWRLYELNTLIDEVCFSLKQLKLMENRVQVEFAYKN